MAITVRKISLSYTALCNRCNPGPTLARMISIFGVQASSEKWEPEEILDVILEVSAGEKYQAFKRWCND